MKRAVLQIVRCYGLAMVFVLVAALARWLLNPILLDHPGSLLFALAVLASAYFGGTGPSIMSAMLSATLVAFYWIEPRHQFSLSVIEAGHLLLFLTLAFAMSGVTERLKRARRLEAEQTRRVLESQQALRTSEARFAGFMQHLPGAAWIENLDHRIIYANQGVRDLVGREPDKLVGRNLCALMPPEVAVRCAEQHRRCLGGETRQRIETLTIQGEQRKLAFTKFAIKGDHDTPTLVAGLVFDVTDRERAIEALQAEMAFRKALETALPAGITALDAQGRRTYVSPAFARMLGWSVEELMARPDWFPYWAEEHREEIAARFRQVCSGNAPPEGFELRFVRRDGQYIDVLVLPAYMRSIHGEPMGWVTSITDITQLKEAQRRLKALTQTLEQRVAERTAVAEQRAVQLRQLNVQLIETERRERRQLAAILHDHLQQLLVAAKMKLAGAARDAVAHDRLRQVIEQVRSVIDESIQASRTLTVELSPPALDQGLAPALHWLARSMHGKYQLSIDVLAEDNAEPADEVMRVFLFEIVRELLFNVVKHAQVLEACVRMRRVNDALEVIVADQGVGFDPAQVQASGEHFGLLNARERLNLFGGRMGITSAPGRGTRVRLIVPLQSTAGARRAVA